MPQVSRSCRCSAWVGHPCRESVRARTWISWSCSCRSVNRSPPRNFSRFLAAGLVTSPDGHAYRYGWPCTQQPSPGARRRSIAPHHTRSTPPCGFGTRFMVSNNKVLHGACASPLGSGHLLYEPLTSTSCANRLRNGPTVGSPGSWTESRIRASSLY